MAKRGRKRRRRSGNSFNIKYIALGAIVLLTAGTLRYGPSAFSKPHVLGASTSILLADKGSDSSSGDSHSGESSGRSGGGGSSSSGSSSQGSSSSSEGSGSSSNNSGPSSNSGPGSVSSSEVKVDCIGPDGKHFTVSFHDCQELNQKWGRANFLFTPLSASKIEREVKNETAEITKKPEKAEIERIRSEINHLEAGAQIEMKREDNGNLTIHAKNPDGSEVKLPHDSIEAINESLKDREIEVSTDSAKNFVIKSKGIEALTRFPLSVDPKTGTLSVVIGNGTKDLNVLPNQAIQNIIDQKLLTSVLSKAEGPTQTSAPLIGLTEVNNEPAFEIQGVTSKKLLGLLPVGFQKTVFVSAVDGHVVKVDQSLINQALQIFSF